jgi:hypothetical protein
MKKTIVCTKKNPLHVQIKKHEKYKIEELKVSGFLGGDDFDVLTAMSQEKGKLRVLDMENVIETDCEIYSEMADDIYVDKISIKDDSFVDSIRLEKVVLPNGIKGIGNHAFSNCVNLRNIEFPENMFLWDFAFQNCPLLGDFYIEGKEGLNYILENAFAGSIRRYVCGFNEWPLNKSGQPICDNEFSDIFSFDGSVFFYNQWWDEEISLVRYPNGCDRSEYLIPEGVREVNQYAFVGNRHLRTLIFPKSCCSLKEHAVTDCSNLETLVFKSQYFYGSRVCHWDMYYDNIITKCPNLKDIYLYAEEPEKIEFDVYGKLDNMNDIVLHVPCFCAKKYRDYEEEYCSMYDYNDKKYVKVWREFKRIEEFDPIDMFGE